MVEKVRQKFGGKIMSPNVIRKRSLEIATRWGFPIHPKLPFFDVLPNARSQEEVVQRLLCLFAVVICTFGADRLEIRAWLMREGLLRCLSNAEKRFLSADEGKSDEFQVMIEGMWALAWALGLVNELDFETYCAKDFADLFPNIQESSADLRAKAKLRPYEDIYAACDLAYCLQWGLRDAELRGAPQPGKLWDYAVRERRRALQWLISNEPWDEISLDT
jgi:hypothetical protein